MTIDNLFNSAELAQAAYADLDDTKGVSHPDNIAVLTDPDGAGMSQKQAEEFAVRYTQVIAISDDPLDTGFSATAFASPTGQLTLAIRGTDGGEWGTDHYLCCNKSRTNSKYLKRLVSALGAVK